MKKKRKNFKNIKRLYITKCVSDKQIITCKICGQKIKSVSGLGTHLLNKHEMTLENYILEYFTCLTPDFQFEKCGFCNKHIAKPELCFNTNAGTYSLSYDNGYMCYEEDCLDEICKDFFNTTHEKAKHRLEHLGTNVKYLSKKYKVTEQFVIENMKGLKNHDYSNAKSKTNLEGYIIRYGKEKGTKLYNERCEKISYSRTIDWYIEQYGVEEGKKKFIERQENFIKSSEDIKFSKNQYKIFNALFAKDNNWKAEQYVGGVSQVDMVNSISGVAIEYYGDYWHCNPEIHNNDFYNKNLKMTALQKQEKDNARLQKILSYQDKISLVIIIWENHFIKYGLTKTLKMVSDCIIAHNKSTKEIKWI